MARLGSTIVRLAITMGRTVRRRGALRKLKPLRSKAVRGRRLPGRLDAPSLPRRRSASTQVPRSMSEPSSRRPEQLRRSSTASTAQNATQSMGNDSSHRPSQPRRSSTASMPREPSQFPLESPPWQRPQPRRSSTASTTQTTQYTGPQSSWRPDPPRRSSATSTMTQPPQLPGVQYPSHADQTRRPSIASMSKTGSQYTGESNSSWRQSRLRHTNSVATKEASGYAGNSRPQRRHSPRRMIAYKQSARAESRGRERSQSIDAAVPSATSTNAYQSSSQGPPSAWQDVFGASPLGSTPRPPRRSYSDHTFPAPSRTNSHEYSSFTINGNNAVVGDQQNRNVKHIHDGRVIIGEHGMSFAVDAYQGYQQTKGPGGDRPRMPNKRRNSEPARTTQASRPTDAQDRPVHSGAEVQKAPQNSSAKPGSAPSGQRPRVTHAQKGPQSKGVRPGQASPGKDVRAAFSFSSQGRGVLIRCEQRGHAVIPYKSSCIDCGARVWENEWTVQELKPCTTQQHSVVFLTDIDCFEASPATQVVHDKGVGRREVGVPTTCRLKHECPVCGMPWLTGAQGVSCGQHSRSQENFDSIV